MTSFRRHWTTGFKGYIIIVEMLQKLQAHSSPERWETKLNKVMPTSEEIENVDINNGDHKLDVVDEMDIDGAVKNTNENNQDEEENSLIGYCQFVVKHTKLAFGITLGAHFLMIIITALLFASGYDILPIDFLGLPLDLQEDSTKLRTDAWVNVKDHSSVAPLKGAQKQRSIQFQSISLLYELKGGNIFTKEHLQEIQKNEKELVMNTEYQDKLCQLVNNTKNNTCKPPLSILRFFDGSYRSIDNGLYGPDFENITAVLKRADSIKVSKAILNFHLGKDADVGEKVTVASSSYTRSLIYTGWPIAGYSTTDDNDDDQADELNKRIVDVFATDLAEKYNDGVGKLNFYYNSPALSNDAIQKQVVLDMMLAVASFIFIFLFMWLQTGSLLLTTWGVFSVLSSFVITNLIYRIIFDYRYIGIFHVLSIFIILGIGSDNIFVFMDTWKQSREESFKTLEHRLSSVYRRAAKATLVTSFTTMMAFLSNVQSPLLAISSFGLFSAILVFVNYCSVILFFPTVIVLHQTSRRGRCCCGPICGGKGELDETASRGNLEDRGETKKSITQKIISFFEGWFFRNIITHKIVRWIVIAIFAVVIAVSIGFATQLEPDTEQINPWKSDTNWGQARELGTNAYRPSQEDRVVIVHIIWGLQEQDRSGCHHTDYKCKGKTVFDKSYDLNPPPCQNAMLKLCKNLKEISVEQQDKLKLRKSSITNEIEIECMFERMDEYLQAESKKRPKYSNGSDFSLPLNSDKGKNLMSANPQLYNNVSNLPDTYYRFFEVGVSYFLINGGDPNYATSYDFEKYSDLLGGAVDPTNVKNETRIQGNKFGNRLLYVGIAINTTLNPSTLGYEEGLPIYENWENFVNDQMDNMPSSCNNGFQATVSFYNVWHWLKVQQILVNNAMLGIAVGIVLALIVLTIATTNFIVGFLATVIIAMITCGVLGMIPILGWKLGLFESLNLTLVVGLAVDYVVHLAEGYMELKDKDRLTRVQYALGHVGISVTSGACTTLGSSIFMLAAKIIFFSQFGIFIFCTIGLSILYSLFLFTTVLALIGPEGETGSLKPIARKVKDLIRGKTKEHVACGTCKGKGFHKKHVNVVNETQF